MDKTIIATWALRIFAILFLVSPATADASFPVPYMLTKTSGDSPFPAVVILHDCSGLGPRSSGAPWRWATRLNALGYVTIWPDSFSTRKHLDGVCTDASEPIVGPQLRAAKSSP